MSRNSKHVLPGAKIEVAFGAASPGPKPDQLPPSEQSGGSTPAASKPRTTKRRARRAERYAARGDDGAAHHPKWKRPNAQKSGVFADPLILPGEDPREFEALHSRWIEEWDPSGPSEESKVFGIADAEWRKLRSRRFVEAKAIANSLTPSHPAFDETRGLIDFGYLLCREPETAFAEYAARFLRTDKIQYLKDKFPRQNFESIEEWAVAVAEEVQSVLLPATSGFAKLDTRKLSPLTEGRRSEIIRMRLFVPIIHARNFLDDDLEQQERLDARIAKLIKELIEIKTNKQVLRRTSMDDEANNQRRNDRKQDRWKRRPNGDE